jgi:colanic acid biosynthesis glycosyl transferase WcaI
VGSKDNRWARKHGLADRPVLLYSGTLARKHRPGLLVDLARSVAHASAVMVVVTEGEGADELAQAKREASDLDNLILLPYQRFEDLPDVLASADVLVVLLEPRAAQFSVPSKTLSYLCAGRPIVASMPKDNTAARIVAERAQCGLVVAPDDDDDDEGFLRAAQQLLSDPVLRESLGRAGRKYAEEHFDSNAIGVRFVRELDAMK